MQSPSQALALLIVGLTTASPADPAQAVHQVHIADLAVQQANVLTDLVRERVPDNEVLGPVGLADLLADATHEQADEHVLEPVRLDVDVHVLRDVPVFLEQLRQGRVLRGARERLGLVLGPGPAEDGDDGRLAHERGSRVALRAAFALEQRSAVQVREIERDVALEEARRREESLALVELQVAPVAEIGSAKLFLPVKIKGISIMLPIFPFPSYHHQPYWFVVEAIIKMEGEMRQWYNLANIQLFSPLQMLGPASRAGHGRELLAALVPGPLVDARVLPLFRGVRHADRPAQRHGRELLNALAIAARRSGKLLRGRRDDVPQLRSLCGGGGGCSFGGAVRRCGGRRRFLGTTGRLLLLCGEPPVRRAEGPALAKPAEQLAPGRERHGSAV